MVTSGEDFPAGSHGANLNLAFSSQNPVDHFAPSHSGHKDTTGNNWEWTEGKILVRMLVTMRIMMSIVATGFLLVVERGKAVRLYKYVGKQG
tara:strand:+ start:143 stop:418 length:276 start_codon:yes stop_codon:yes gene_type:complete